ncbi:NADP-dependent oxidoreductase [Pengzhenrongella sicca]|uniref:NADP-dependent oxidoreductase n=1 Tax=Pengzhenrongella sicca TaxID=2819238 RepID=A0A8A4ZDH7_9MICO|nr:NADP-dependent oxidoreductase [Pengzhenrongella sicca]QTE28943.1 NADP-dependent oxidoreductase [Pengzhenrongella sicca]
MRAVQFDRFGDEGVLQVRDVEDPVPGHGQVLVRVRAAAINPGEVYIRQGLAEQMWPTTFPSGQGSDLAGEVVDAGDSAGRFAVGQPVLGWTNGRASHAELVAVPASQLVPKPDGLSWAVAGSLFIAPMAALASVRAVDPKPGESVAVSAAAGGVGAIAVQLARRTGATVIGLAGVDNHEWLRSHGVIPVAYGDGQAKRVLDAAGGRLSAFVDTFGTGYVDLAMSLGVSASRINTVADYEAVRRLGVSFQGAADVAASDNLAEMAQLAATGAVEVPIAATFSLNDVQNAYRALARRHTHGKIVLLP